ncbi:MULTISPECIES: hypothetical protein [Actinomyces]|uniref:hypothetical protein n=1 Tax=Actinomyces TaxID=1654 RepID=UPI001FAA8822|nr:MULTISPECIES: hypothetical protein [Actinomyces]
MGVMIVPLAVVLVAALLVLGVVIADRYPVRSWPQRVRGLVQDAREEEPGVEVVAQEAHLSELMTREGPAVYTGTDSFQGLVDVVEKAMDSAERARESAGSRAQELEARRRQTRAAKTQVQHSGPING